MKMRIIFSNSTGEFLIQAADKEFKFKATSGKDECMNNQNCEKIPNKGSTPVGAYYIIGSQLDDPSFAKDLARMAGLKKVLAGEELKFADWGDFRIRLYPQANTQTHGRDNMFIHGGVLKGSAGCIDIGGGIYGDEKTNKIKDLIKLYAKQGAIRVDVINGPILDHHKNQSRDVTLPKEVNLKEKAAHSSTQTGSMEAIQKEKIRIQQALASLEIKKQELEEGFMRLKEKMQASLGIQSTEPPANKANSTNKMSLLDHMQTIVENIAAEKFSQPNSENQSSQNNQGGRSRHGR